MDVEVNIEKGTSYNEPKRHYISFHVAYILNLQMSEEDIAIADFDSSKDCEDNDLEEKTEKAVAPLGKKVCAAIKRVIDSEIDALRKKKK